MVESTLKLGIQYGVELEPEDDPIECAIHETHDFLYRFDFWADQIHQATGTGIITFPWNMLLSVGESVFELEMLGWQHEPLPDVYPELDLWLSYLTNQP